MLECGSCTGASRPLAVERHTVAVVTHCREFETHRDAAAGESGDNGAVTDTRNDGVSAWRTLQVWFAWRKAGDCSAWRTLRAKWVSNGFFVPNARSVN